eukprot:6577512-Pyramimonas_sp.AAC.1
MTPTQIDPAELLTGLEQSGLAELVGRSQMVFDRDGKVPQSQTLKPADTAAMGGSELMAALRSGNLSSPALANIMGSFSNELVRLRAPTPVGLIASSRRSSSRNDGPIRRRKRGYILTRDQSDAYQLPPRGALVSRRVGHGSLSLHLAPSARRHTSRAHIMTT